MTDVGKQFTSEDECTQFVGTGGVFGTSNSSYNAGIFLTNETGETLFLGIKPMGGVDDCTSNLNSAEGFYFRPHETFRFDFEVENTGFCAIGDSHADWAIYPSGEKGLDKERHLIRFYTLTHAGRSGWSTICYTPGGPEIYKCIQGRDRVWNTLNKSK